MPLEKKRSGLFSGFGVLIIWGIIGSAVLSIIASFLCHPKFLLNENQLLYLFSSMAQIIGSVFGLTLTAYVFFVDKFRESAKNDDTYYDATISLLRQFFNTLILIAVICGLTILTCILGIISLHNWTTAYPLLINESVLLFVLAVASILLFGVMLLDPEKLDKEIKRQAESLHGPEKNDRLGDFTEFLRYYNLLQEVVVNFASSLVYNTEVSSQFFRDFKPQIIQSLKVLNGKQIINDALSTEINDFRIYRNGLVHGIDFTIPQSACDRVKEIYNAINKVYEIYKSNPKGTDALNGAIEEVRDLAKKYETS